MEDLQTSLGRKEQLSRKLVETGEDEQEED